MVPATIKVEDRGHPSTAMLPARWTRVDEWYNFAANPRPNVKVLMSLDESGYAGGNKGTDHPIAWYHEYGGGRAWYSGLGHTPESYLDSMFLAHLSGGIAYVMGRETPTALAPRFREAGGRERETRIRAIRGKLGFRRAGQGAIYDAAGRIRDGIPR